MVLVCTCACTHTHHTHHGYEKYTHVQAASEGCRRIVVAARMKYRNGSLSVWSLKVAFVWITIHFEALPSYHCLSQPVSQELDLRFQVATACTIYKKSFGDCVTLNGHPTSYRHPVRTTVLVHTKNKNQRWAQLGSFSESLRQVGLGFFFQLHSYQDYSRAIQRLRENVQYLCWKTNMYIDYLKKMDLNT